MRSLISYLILYERQFSIFIACIENTVYQLPRSHPCRKMHLRCLCCEFLSWIIGRCHYINPLSIGILQARIQVWVAMPSSRGSFQHRGVKPTVPTLQEDFSPSEPPGKPKNNAVGNYPFSRGSSQPGNQTGVFCTAGRVFTSWATREA